MGFRFQRHVNTGLGRINISKSGVSLSEGVPGFRVTIGKTPRLTLGLPGSGLSWTQTLPRGRQGQGSVAGIIGGLIGLAIAAAVLSFIASYGS